MHINQCQVCGRVNINDASDRRVDIKAFFSIVFVTRKELYIHAFLLGTIYHMPVGDHIISVFEAHKKA